VAGSEAYLHAMFHLDSSNRFASITNVTDRETGQTDNGMIAKGEPFYKRSPKKLSTPSRPVSLYIRWYDTASVAMTRNLHRPM